MKKRIAVVGAGMGGLTAAIKLAQHNFQVSVFESRNLPGGLASSSDISGFRFDSGPYILLDCPGLVWAFQNLGFSFTENIPLLPLDPVYEVIFRDETFIRFHKDIKKTADEIETRWHGAGKKYVLFIEKIRQRYAALKPLLYQPPGIFSFLRSDAWRQAFFLLHSLKSILTESKLPADVQRALSIWTHIAGQDPAEAPSPLAFVPAIFHSDGAFYPQNGIGQIPEVLANEAKKLGVEFHFQTKVLSINCENKSARGIVTEPNEFQPFDAVVSNAHGLSTYLNLIKELPDSAQKYLKHLPLQSPGICIYMRVKSTGKSPYLRFFLDDSNSCYLFVRPGALLRSEENLECARLIAPMNHKIAQDSGSNGQKAAMQQLLDDPRWRKVVSEIEILDMRIPKRWGDEFHLYQDSMNPVMTAQFMRAGRLRHRSPWIRNLYLCGSSTHPGQWVSFSAISGILAAESLIQDFGKC